MRRSAGILLYRVVDDGAEGRIEVLLGHMGGPFWARKDAGAWTIPKGEHEPDEDPLGAARREFEEETGVPLPVPDVVDLGEVRQSGGKVVRAWAVEGDLDASTLESNTFTMEWPRGSGEMATFPELDRFEWFDLETARSKIIVAQREFLDRLAPARSAPAESRSPGREGRRSSRDD
jgi:predicted NUDIX family NTP pyrophosphohydrolase